jgi:hypothetical protein
VTHHLPHGDVDGSTGAAHHGGKGGHGGVQPGDGVGRSIGAEQGRTPFVLSGHPPGTGGGVVAQRHPIAPRTDAPVTGDADPSLVGLGVNAQVFERPGLDASMTTSALATRAGKSPVAATGIVTLSLPP